MRKFGYLSASSLGSLRFVRWAHQDGSTWRHPVTVRGSSSYQSVTELGNGGSAAARSPRPPRQNGRMGLGSRDRVYLVTGGSRGLGFAAAQALVADGARVVLSAPHQATILD